MSAAGAAKKQFFRCLDLPVCVGRAQGQGIPQKSESVPVTTMARTLSSSDASRSSSRSRSIISCDRALYFSGRLMASTRTCSAGSLRSMKDGIMVFVVTLGLRCVVGHCDGRRGGRRRDRRRSRTGRRPNDGKVLRLTGKPVAQLWVDEATWIPV